MSNPRGGETVKILVVDPYPCMRVGLTVCLRQVRNGVEVEEAGTLAEAMRRLDDTPFDLVMLSLTLPDSTGIATANAVFNRPGSPNVAIFTGFSDENIEVALMDTPARAIIKKDWPLERQMDILAFLLRGIDAAGSASSLPRDHDTDLAAILTGLSPRRRQVLELICRGYRNKEIARALQLEENTVKIHVRHILRALGATNRIQAALIGRPALETAARQG